MKILNGILSGLALCLVSTGVLAEAAVEGSKPVQCTFTLEKGQLKIFNGQTNGSGFFVCLPEGTEKLTIMTKANIDSGTGTSKNNCGKSQYNMPGSSYTGVALDSLSGANYDKSTQVTKVEIDSNELSKTTNQIMILNDTGGVCNYTFSAS